jgi:hypothetical protein
MLQFGRLDEPFYFGLSLPCVQPFSLGIGLCAIFIHLNSFPWLLLSSYTNNIRDGT